MRTSFHHQPEAQHPKSPAIYTPAGRLPHLWVISDRASSHENPPMSALLRKRPNRGHAANDAKCQKQTFTIT
jgi:hypothetical protein